MRRAVVLAALLFACARESTPGPVEADPEEIACAEDCAGWGGTWTGGMCDTCTDGIRSCQCWQGSESDAEARATVCQNLRAWSGCDEWVGR